MSSTQIKEECDSCYGNSTDEEVEKFAFATDGFKEVERFAFTTDGSKEDDHSDDARDGSKEDDCKAEDDKDSVDPVLEFEYDEPQGKIAFCCQNCR
jgi:hypothetical protein